MAARLAEIEGHRPPPRAGCAFLIVATLVLLIGGRWLASSLIEYEWWNEMGQVQTWLSLLLYGSAPVVIATVIAFLTFWIAHSRGMRLAGTRTGEHRTYTRLVSLVLLAIAAVVAAASMDTWAAVRFFGARGLPLRSEWHDPVFNRPLSFYFFDLPFYSQLLGLALAVSIGAILIYWITGRSWQLQRNMPQWSGGAISIDLQDLLLRGARESQFLRLIGAVALLALAARFFLSRYAMLNTDHSFMTGVDYVSQNVGLPLQWVVIAACLIAAGLVSTGRPAMAILTLLAALLLRGVIPPVVSWVYVKPNEISLERPFIARHIEATRSAFGLNRRTRETQFTARPDVRIDIARHKALLDNVRLWDWRAFHDTVSQIQPLRPYVFSDTDIDRYTIDGQVRQVLISPRELDLNQLGDARNRWINPHFIYTHGYGLVMAEANRITPNGLPELFIQNAPPEIRTPSLKLTRPELYFGEIVHEPVFVRTAQPEFNYPSGTENVHTRYEGKGGIPIGSFGMRLAAAIWKADWNVLFTGQFTAESRMLIHRQVRERLGTLAAFVMWDEDPYLVIGNDGRLVWVVDGYLTADSHPYSRNIALASGVEFNYIRNSVKATVDAYDGTARIYVYDADDPLLQAYQHLFPSLFRPAASMPADVRAHARYPETIFRAQAEMYRTFHMRDPENFYNKADLWDVAKSSSGQETKPAPLTPTYIIATLPGEQQPEFLLTLPFTPRTRDNLIGLMMARCDGEHLGEIVFLQLSKQDVILGPMQVQARINQDQNISKDLTLWNQQGSQVVRGQVLVLPIENTFLYVEPIYIQASEARMPQLKKVALATGNTLIYSDSYDQALAQLGGTGRVETASAPSQPVSGGPKAAAILPSRPASARVVMEDSRISEVRDHLRRYRELVSQGKLSDAGRELEAVQALVER